jgi:Uma2 family endonuclease
MMATKLASIHRFTTDEYERMVRLGIVPSDSAQLIDGRVFVDGSLWRFSTADYYRLAGAGILTEDDRVELIEGEILDMAAIGSRHAGTVNRFNALLGHRLGGEIIVSVQSPLHIRDGVEPEPDIMVLRAREDFYTDSHPTAADVLLLIEVADTSVGFDRTEKADLYASAAVAEYWLVDLGMKRVLVHTGPMPAGYARVETKDVDDSWTAISLPQLTVSGTDIFG